MEGCFRPLHRRPQTRHNAYRGRKEDAGARLLRGPDRLLAEETGMPVTLTDDPLGTVVLGCCSTLVLALAVLGLGPQQRLQSLLSLPPGSLKA